MTPWLSALARGIKKTARFLVSPYVWPWSLFVLLNFSPAQKERLRDLRIQGSAIYSITFDLTLPTANLIERVFGDSIRAFKPRPLIVLVGNSALMGWGTIDKLYLNERLAKNHNVINAALNGETVAGSVLMALYGMELAFQDGRPRSADIFMAYLPSKIFAKPEVRNFNDALSDICSQYGLSRYANCPKTKKYADGIGMFRDQKNALLQNMRCLTTPSEFYSCRDHLTWHCMHFYERNHSSIKFLEMNRAGATAGPQERERYLGGFDSSFSGKEFDATVENFAENIETLRRFLVAKRADFKIHFILLRESPSLLDSLPPRERKRTRRLELSLLSRLSKRLPEVRFEAWGFFKPEDYYDPGHYRESGQQKIAEAILKEAQN